MANNTSLAVYQVENALKVTDALGAYLNGDVEPSIALCDAHVVWRSIAEPEHAPFGGVYHGPGGVRSFFGKMFGAYHILEPRIVDIIPAGDEVLHVMKLQAVKIDGSADGAAYVVGRWRFQHGAVVSYTDYFNVPASIQTSEHARANGAKPVTRDPSFAIYQNENAVLVLDILTAYRAGNLEPLFKRLHPDVAWRSLSEPHHAKFGGLFRGRDAVKTFFRRLSESLTMEEYRVIDVLPAGHETISVAECFVHVVGDPARKACIRLVNVWTFDGGMVTAMTEYFNVPAYRAQLKLD